MLKDKVVKLLNDQLNFELSSSYLYLSMAAWFEEQNLVGFAKWMRIQANEEYAHGMKFFEYLVQIGAKVDLQKIDAPKYGWKSTLDVFENTLEHEKKVTSNIHNILDVAMTEKDFATGAFLQWFISEQVEEEATANYVVERLKIIGDSKGSLLYIDKEMGKRA